MEELVPIQEVMVEFRAGKMYSEGARVVPDSRKGLVRIGRGEEGLVHFQWLDRTQNTVEDDQIIFPDEAVFEKEPKSDGDLQICNSVNYHINRPLEEEIEDPLQMPEMSEHTIDGELSSRAGNLVDQTTGGELAGEVTSGPVQLVDLQRILRSIQPGEGVEDPDGGFGLGDILRPDLVMPLIETLPLEQGLASYLPEGPWTPEAFLDLLQSPPFRQQVDTFTHVLRTGQIDLSQFGIDPSKYKFTVLSFLEALEDSVTKAQSSNSGGGEAMDES